MNTSTTSKAPIIWPMLRQYPKLVIPETWSTLEDFVAWYMANGKPICVPWNAKTIRTDDATAMCIFRKGNYQVEMYLIHPGYDIPSHSHPDMEVITVSMGGGGIFGNERLLYGTSVNAGQTSKIVPGQYHGADITKHGDGFMLLSFEKWLNGIEPTSAAIQWDGPTAGPIHDALIGKE